MRPRSDDEDRDVLRAHMDARFRGPLMSFFSRRVGQRAEAEDLTQEVFARILGAETRVSLEQADGLIFTIAANLLRDRHRRARTRRADGHVPLDDVSIAEIMQTAEEVPNPERVLLGKASLNDALNALDELGQRTKDIFMLVKLENMRHREVAALLGIATSTVEKHVIRATVHLALKLGQER